MEHFDHSLVLFEDSGFSGLLPLVYWRDCSTLRCGRYTLQERIEGVLGKSVDCSLVRADLGVDVNVEGACLFVNGRGLLFGGIQRSKRNLVGRVGGEVAYVWADAEMSAKLFEVGFLDSAALEAVLVGVDEVQCDIELMGYPWDLVQANTKALVADWEGGERVWDAKKIYDGVHIINDDAVSLGAGSVVMPGVVLDAENGPIVIGENVIIKPNASLEGPLFIGDGTIVQPNALIRSGTTVGPVCRVGGEVSSTILQGYSNKQHDGFLGHSYVGQWVNLGAGTVTSNLKNTYGAVKVAINGVEVDSGQTFVGLTIGDFSKVGIGTRFATGTVVGFGCSIFTESIPPRFVPSFSWLTSVGISPVVLEKGVAMAETVMGRRDVAMDDKMRVLFKSIAELAKTIEKTEQIR